MQKKLLVVALLAVSGLSQTCALAGDPGSAVLQSRLKEMYPKTVFTSVQPSEVSGLYEVAMGKNFAYTNDEGRYFLFGHLYDMRTQQDLTASRVEAASKVNFSELPLGDAIKVVHGDGKRVVAVFNDPDCPYCKKLDAEMSKLNNVTIYTFLFPLESLHPNAKTKSISAWCAPDRVAALQAIMKGKEPLKAVCDNPIEKNLLLGARLGINGTPSLISSDGRIMPGAGSVEQIDQWLNAGVGG